MLELTTTKGDLPGHPFRGNQWTGGRTALQTRIDDFVSRAQGGLQDNAVEVYKQLQEDSELAAELKKRSIEYLGGDPEKELVVYRTTKAEDFGPGVPKYASWTTDLKALKKLAETGMGSNAVSAKVKVGNVAVVMNAFTDRLRWQREVLLDRSVGLGGLIPIDPFTGQQKSPSRLAVAKHLLSVATQAVQLKRMLLKDQLRNAVVKAVHVKQYEETERELTEAVSELIKRQFASASKTAKEDGSTDFNPREWDGDLIDTCLPVLMKKAGEAAAAQMLLMGVDVAPRGKRTKGTKASRATEWLLALEDEGEDLSDLWPEAFSLPGGGAVDLAFATEWPAWMKAEITKQMKETFGQPFWAGINDTTAQGIQNYVEKGLLEGWSIREIQQEMVGDGLDEFYRNRGQNIARTESGNALNGARSAAMDRLQEEVPGLKVKRTWMSVLGTTTRDSHAELDGVPADSDGLWYLGGVRVPWPGHWNLPVGERANCQCTLTQSWGQSDEAAEQLIEEYNQRLAEERAARDFWTKGDYAGHPFRGNQWSGGGGSSVREHAAEMISRLDAMFKGPGRAAAVNEVLTAAEYPEYLKGILMEAPGVDEIEAVVEWSVRRGRIWEAA